MKLGASSATVDFALDVAPDGSSGPGQEVVFVLRRLTGRDARELADLWARPDKRGRVGQRSGEAVCERVVRSVVEIRGLEDMAGNQITAMNAAIFDQLPSWMCAALVSKVDDINGFDAGE